MPASDPMGRRGRLTSTLSQDAVAGTRTGSGRSTVRLDKAVPNPS